MILDINNPFVIHPSNLWWFLLKLTVFSLKNILCRSAIVSWKALKAVSGFSSQVMLFQESPLRVALNLLILDSDKSRNVWFFLIVLLKLVLENVIKGKWSDILFVRIAVLNVDDEVFVIEWSIRVATAYCLLPTAYCRQNCQQFDPEIF